MTYDDLNACRDRDWLNEVNHGIHTLWSIRDKMDYSAYIALFSCAFWEQQTLRGKVANHCEPWFV